MQAVQWYARRLRAMTPREVAWRARTALHDERERLTYVARRGREPRAAAPLLFDAPPPFRLAPVDVELPAERRARLLGRADALLQHRFVVHGVGEQYIGSTIDWNRDFEAGRSAPLRFATNIDYRDFDVVGDAQLVWQLNRHQHLTVLGYAYRVSGRLDYAKAVARDLTSWLDQCPYPLGLNWRDSLELAVRLVNWTWTIDLVRDSGVLGPISGRLAASIARHVEVIARRYAHGSSANNHRIGEAAGVFVACSYFPGLPKASDRRAVARDVLLQELDTQVFPDGASREQSFGYHRFVTELFELAAIVDRKRGVGFSPPVTDRIARMREFTRAMCAGGPPPRFGDDDDGHVLGAGLHVWERVPAHPDALASQAFEHAGHYLLQSGVRDERVSVHVRCGPFGLGRLAAHAHADELSITLRLFGEDVLVDPGTYDYFRDAAWRRYFRSTAAHNTVTVDGCDQAVMAGAFLWERHPSARLCEWQPSRAGGIVVGQHRGYTRLADPVVHTRTVGLDAAQRRLTVEDELQATGAHDYALAFNVAPRCCVRGGERPHHFAIVTPQAVVAVTLDPVLDVDVVRGQVDPIAGWASPAYHRKFPIDAIVGRVSTAGGAVLRTTFEWHDRR